MINWNLFLFLNTVMSREDAKTWCLHLIDTIQSSQDKGEEIDGYVIDTLFTMTAWIEKGYKKDPMHWVDNYLAPSYRVNLAKILCFEISKFSAGIRKRNRQEYNDASFLYRLFVAPPCIPTMEDYTQFEHTDECCTLMNLLANQFNKFGVDFDVHNEFSMA